MRAQPSACNIARRSPARSLHMVIGLSKRQPPKPPSPSYQKPQESYILHGVSIAQFRFCVSSFCNFLLAWLHSSCVVWPTGLGNFHKHFLTNLATELLTHSVHWIAISFSPSFFLAILAHFPRGRDISPNDIAKKHRLTLVLVGLRNRR